MSLSFYKSSIITKNSLKQKWKHLKLCSYPIEWLLSPTLNFLLGDSCVTLLQGGLCMLGYNGKNDSVNADYSICYHARLNSFVKLDPRTRKRSWFANRKENRTVPFHHHLQWRKSTTNKSDTHQSDPSTHESHPGLTGPQQLTQSSRWLLIWSL